MQRVGWPPKDNISQLPILCSPLVQSNDASTLRAPKVVLPVRWNVSHRSTPKPPMSNPANKKLVESNQTQYGKNSMVNKAETTWRPTASLASLKTRSEILWQLRRFFHEHQMLEVHTPLLSHDTVIDRHIDPVQVSSSLLGLADEDDCDLYLQTSPEFCMKRLVSAGMPHIYQICSVFRAGERGDFHNPEFTMVEWYRTGDSLSEAVVFLGELVSAALGSEEPEIETYRQVFLRTMGIDPIACPVRDLAATAIERGLAVEPAWSEDRDDWLNLLFAELVQPQLGLAGRPAIVTHYPATQSALACLSQEDPQTAERFELFIDGIELANGYHELRDASELERRDVEVSAQRISDGKSAFGPMPQRMHAAMRQGLPDCSGCALGLDRLIMVALKSNRIDEVIAFPIERA